MDFSKMTDEALTAIAYRLEGLSFNFTQVDADGITVPVLELVYAEMAKRARAEDAAKKKADRAASIRGVQDRADERAAAAK